MTYRKPSEHILRRRRLRGGGLFSKKVALNIAPEDLDQEGHVENVTVSVHGPTQTARGTNLGVGAEPAYVIGRRIEWALDPTKAPGKVRSLNDMTPEERSRISAELGVPVPDAPPEKPKALYVEHVRLGPEYEYTVNFATGYSQTFRRSDLFLTDHRYWREIMAVQVRFRLYRKDKFEFVYTVKPSQREAVLALGVRSVNRIEERVLKRNR